MTNMKNPVKTPFFAILCCCSTENLSVSVRKIGAIPIGFIRLNKVEIHKKVKITNCENIPVN